jgi:hypothetical protein
VGHAMNPFLSRQLYNRLIEPTLHQKVVSNLAFSRYALEGINPSLPVEPTVACLDVGCWKWFTDRL